MKNPLSTTFLATSITLGNAAVVTTFLDDIAISNDTASVPHTLVVTQDKTANALSIPKNGDKVHVEEEKGFSKTIETTHNQIINFLQINPWADTPEEDRKKIKAIILKETGHVLTNEEAEKYTEILQDTKVREELYSKFKNDDIWKIGSLFFVLLLSLAYANAYKQQIVDQLKKGLPIKTISFITFGSISGMMAYINGMIPGSAVYLVSFSLASLSVGIHKYNEKHGLLRENEILKEFAKIAPYPIVQYTKDGYPTIWNPNMEEETGYSHETIIAHYEEMKEISPREECKYIIMRFLYKGKNLEKVEEYIKILKTGKGYENIAFTMDTKYGEKTFLWSALPDKIGGDTRTARHLTNMQEIERELKNTRELLRTSLRIDVLTKACTRYALDEDMTKLITRNNRDSDTENTMMFFLDIDDFKGVNDRYGHEIGDNILKKFVKHIRNNIREGDEIYRYGGDEFLLFMKGDNIVEISKKVDKMRHDFYELEQVGTSWGSVVYNQQKIINTVHDPKKVIKVLKKEADRYMYAVKYYRVIKDDLIEKGKIQENQKVKNGLAVPEYDKQGELTGVQVFSEFITFFMTLEELQKIEQMLKADPSLTRRIL